MELRNRLACAALVAALLGSGCTGKKDSAVVVATPGTGSAGQAAPAPPEPGTSPINPTGESSAKAEPGKAPAPPPKGVVVPPGKLPPPTKLPDPKVAIPPIKAAGTGGWRASSKSASELGRAVDQALASLKGAYAEARLLLDLPSGKGEVKSSLTVLDPKRYKLEYNLPSTNVEPYAIISNGKQRSKLLAGKWSAPSTTPAPTDVTPVQSEKVVSEFPDKFPLQVVVPISERKAVWEPLFAGWSDGMGGYRAVVEEQVAKVNNKERKYYRVIAQRGKDDQRIEVLVDGIRFVPITIRVQKSGGKGKSSSVQWQSKWSFNKPIEAKEFALPKP